MDETPGKFPPPRPSALPDEKLTSRRGYALVSTPLDHFPYVGWVLREFHTDKQGAIEWLAPSFPPKVYPFASDALAELGETVRGDEVPLETATASSTPVGCRACCAASPAPSTRSSATSGPPARG